LDVIQLDLTRALLQQPDLGLLPAEAEAQARLSADRYSNYGAYSNEGTTAGMSSSSGGTLWWAKVEKAFDALSNETREKVAQFVAACGRRPERYLTKDCASDEEEGNMVSIKEGKIVFKGAAAYLIDCGLVMYILWFVMWYASEWSKYSGP
jgi:hypothetical protein